ncbi:aldo-keto reductase family 1 member B1 [Condylostylus longicornis]|uniref:aldo-keto reductase family 1 member B1 n=1 Tax=Condylostylus longicornis TaxID=2530218 RepID=UPI00244E1FAC|nr:aldo-keto reductase family 1 member B1 [Condylostylus longicornis]
MACKKFLTLNNGLKMPSIGIGTWMAPDHEIEAALDLALKVGYRHIDAAPVYLNEKAIGRVLKKWLDSNQIKREDLFITTKLPPPANRPSCVEKTLRNSLNDLQLSYVDMYLIHTPFSVPETGGDFERDANGDIVIDPTTDHIEIWKTMEKMVELGLTKSIGISNFNKKQIQRLLDNSKTKPSNLQIELHLYFQQNELVDLCKANNIVVTAYSPLGSRGIVDLKKSAGVKCESINLIENPKVLEIAENHKKTPAQILLRWIIQRDVCAIPKSTNPERLQQNLNIWDFELSNDEMSSLSKLDKGIRVCDFSFFKGMEKHPEFPW